MHECICVCFRVRVYRRVHVSETAEPGVRRLDYMRMCASRVCMPTVRVCVSTACMCVCACVCRTGVRLTELEAVEADEARERGVA